MKKIFFVSVLFVIAMLLVIPASTRTAHAQFIGTVCIDPAIAQATAPAGCSTAPVTLGGTSLTVGSTFSLEVDVAGSDTTNGFEVAVMTDPNVLLPLSANITGAGTLVNILGSPLTLVNCINNGVGGSATNCVPGIDGLGVAHMAVTSLGGLSNPPTTGRLMYVNYQVKSLTTGSPIVYVQNADPTICGASSHPPDCVFISNGGGGFDTENIQTASFANQVLDNTSTSVVCSPNTIVPGATSTCTASVSDTTTPANTPTGTVSFTSSNTAVGTVGASCVLTSGSCAVTFTSVGPTGTATVSGTYAGDATHNGSSGTSGTITVAKDNTTTAVSCAPASINIGGTSTCTASVTDTTNAARTATGTVSFTSSNTAVGTVAASCTLVSGSCTAVFTGVAAGTATVTGSYGGDATHNGSSGTSNAITVVKDNTTTAVSCAPASINIGGTSTCTATVTDTTTASRIATGSVSFTSSSTAVGTVGASCTLGGTGTCTVAFTGVNAGTATVSGTYGGDANHNGSGPTASNAITVVKDNTTTAVSCAPASINIGGTSTCTATVTDTTTASRIATGSVSFTSSSTAVGTVGASCTLGGTGTCTVAFTGVNAGTATVSGTYAGDANHNGSGPTASNTITVNKDNTSTAVSCTTPINIGGTSTCTATVADTTSAARTATGTVSFTSSNSTVGTVGASCTLGGTGTCTVAFTGVNAGTATVSGTYAGDANHNGSGPTASNTITVPPTLRDNTSTGVSCSTPINIGGTSTCTATVTDTTNAANTPTGSVSFTSSNVAVGTVGASCTLGASGTCTVTFTGVGAGTATVSGTYGGDANHNASPAGTSNTITVNKDNTSTAVLCSPNSIAIGATSTCTATVSDTTTPANTPTSTVTFTLSAGTTGGTLSASSCLLSAGSCSVTFQGSTVNGTASVTGAYGGDANHNTSTSVAATITVNPRVADNTSTAVVCSPNSIGIGATSTCTATVSDTTTPANTPTGTVTFVSSNTAVGTVAASCTLVSGTCSVAFTGVATGTATVTGTYVPADTNAFNGSSGTSGTITVTVLPPQFVHGKLSWTHHLSLAKSGGSQSFTAKVEDLATIPVYVQVVVTGSYDNGLPYTAMSAVTLLQPGIVTSVSFTQAVPTGAIGFKICFTATLSWGTTSALEMATTGTNTKSGCFAVVP